jgi:undecaprenyl-diphosphatase
MRAYSLIERVGSFELTLCSKANLLCRSLHLQYFFSLISRLGNGVFWYVLIALLPLVFGANAVHVSLRMAAAGAIGVVVYKIIKSMTERPRPYAKQNDIQLGAAPLDRYSFPSGHTLHAVSFTIICLNYFPQLAWLLIPFASLVAVSRVVLGLHYPTDVLAGAIIGGLLGFFAISF